MKRLIGTIIALFLFLVIAFFSTLQPTTFSNAKGVPTIGILQLTTHPALDAIHKGIIAGLEKEGYVPGKSVNIDFQNAEADQSNLKSMSDKFNNENVNLMIGIATPSAQSLANVTKKTPIILGAVTDPKGSGLVSNNQKPGNNITGVSDQAPIKAQLALMKELMPNMKTVGVLYTSSDDSATKQYQQFKSAAIKSGLEVKSATITSTNDVDQVSQSLVASVDAVYVPTDNTVASSMQTLVKNATQAKIPIFPAVDTMVKNGGLATISINQYDLGVATGKMAAAVLSGKSVPATTPINFVKKGDLIINLKTAKALNITIPQALIDQAKNKGELIK
ncbi:tryptophan ABC transporter substrate-binding protein [Dellaglioa sp. P0083]|uniref:tryptophan ABC transporter substrate-binding protein n=1 Tax=Dellaglioa kimchii TaxID=3344667 RepID=UPI0038D38953